MGTEAVTFMVGPIIVSLYRRAFAEFGTMALWSMQASAQPHVRRCPRNHSQSAGGGKSRARRLAEQIEQACHAAHTSAVTV